MTDEIHKMICLSTAHVCGDTAKHLEDEWPSVRMPVHYQKGEYGWFVHVSTDYTEEELSMFPDDIQAILAYARARGCGWIMLDIDGPVVDGLKTWEW